jgi:hypothetical protein
MVFDLNSKPPDQGEAFTNMDEEPPDELPFPFNEAILDLDEGPPEEEQPFQIQGTHEAQLVGGGTAGVQNEGISSGK